MSPEDPRLAAGTDPTLRVLVAVPIPLQRALVQFFMQEAGFELLPIPLPNVNVAYLAAHDHPDAIVLHESVAKPWDSGLVDEVRRDSPSTKIVVLAQAPEEAWAGPARGADAYLEEWVGIAELEGVLRDLCPVGSTLVAAGSAQTVETPGLEHLPIEEAEQETPMPAASARTRGGRWYERIQGAAAAALILFALLRGPGMFQETASIQGQTGAADASLDVAYSSFQLLVADLQQGSPSSVLIQDAGDLRAALATAMAAGADVRNLSAEIASQVQPLLENVPADTASAIVAALGGLVEQPSPAPEPSPSPSASDTPSPSASDTPSPSASSSTTGPLVQQAQGADTGGPGGTPHAPALTMTLVFAVLPASSWWLRAGSRRLS
ncbi:MAG: hypothetical protein M3P43_17640 [Actinomycetota bacterium]|nr:hypothetical protein [Actinomycetota bacterium]